MLPPIPSRRAAFALLRRALWFLGCNLLAAALSAQCTGSNTTKTDLTYSSPAPNVTDNNAVILSGDTITSAATLTVVAGNCVELKPSALNNFSASSLVTGPPTPFHAWVETVPSAVSFTPSYSSGYTPTFTFTASSPSGYGNLQNIYALFSSSSTSTTNACYIHYSVTSNLLFLADNNGNWYPGFAPGTSNSAGNLQCGISGAGASVPPPSGNQITVIVPVTFQPAFVGTWSEYLEAYDKEGLNTGWQTMGNWTVPTPSFTLSLQPSSQSTTFNHEAYYAITATPSGGLASPISLGMQSISPSLYGTYSFTYGYLSPANNWTDTLTVTPQSVANTYTLTVRGSVASTFRYGSANLTAVSNLVPQYTLTATVGTGSGSVSPCSSPACTVASGSQITLWAQPNPGYTFAGFTGQVASSSNPVTVTVTAATTETANFTHQGSYTASTLSDLNNCIQNLTQYSVCQLSALNSPYRVDAPITITRNVTVTGGGQLSQPMLVRGWRDSQNNLWPYTGDIIDVNVPAFAQPGVTISGLTICGGLDRLYDLNSQTTVSLGQSSICPRNQTTPNFDSGSCGDMLYRETFAWGAGQKDTFNNGNDFFCTDINVLQADTGEYQASPFPTTAHYSLTIVGVDLEDSTGNALTLYENANESSFVNDLLITNNSINGSGLTGILYGQIYAGPYYPSVCDGNPNWLNDRTVYAPRNLRIENNYFGNNNTGAMGSGAVRWVGLRGNTFFNNYIHPQGQNQGGTIAFDPCADQLQISNNYFYAPTVTDYKTFGLELYSRDVQIDNNFIGNYTDYTDPSHPIVYPGYALQGIMLASTFNASASNNTIQNNNTTAYDDTGGIAVSTTQSIFGPCSYPRDSTDVTISGGTSTGNGTSTGGGYGIYLQNHDLFSTSTLRRQNNTAAFSVSGVNLAGNPSGQIAQDSVVYLGSYSGPSTTPVPGTYPNAVTVYAVSPVGSTCSEGTGPETFVFAGADGQGAGNVEQIEVFFSVAGTHPTSDGPKTTSGACHFAYYPGATPSYPSAKGVVYLDDPSGGSTWPNGQSSPVGPGLGSDLSNGSCTLHVGWTPAAMAQPFISTNIASFPIVVEFPSTVEKYIYTVVENWQNSTSPPGRPGIPGTSWMYWGWWK